MNTVLPANAISSPTTAENEVTFLPVSRRLHRHYTIVNSVEPGGPVEPPGAGAQQYRELRRVRASLRPSAHSLCDRGL